MRAIQRESRQSSRWLGGSESLVEMMGLGMGTIEMGMGLGDDGMVRKQGRNWDLIRHPRDEMRSDQRSDSRHPGGGDDAVGIGVDVQTVGKEGGEGVIGMI